MGQARPGAVTERFQGGSSRRLGRRSERSQVGGDEVGTLAGEGALEQGRRAGWWCAAASGVRRRRRPAWGFRRRGGPRASRTARRRPGASARRRGRPARRRCRRRWRGGPLPVRPRPGRARHRGTGGFPLRVPGSPWESVPCRGVAREHPRVDRSPGRVRPGEDSRIQHKAWAPPLTTPERTVSPDWCAARGGGPGPPSPPHRRRGRRPRGAPCRAPACSTAAGPSGAASSHAATRGGAATGRGSRLSEAGVTRSR